MHRSIQEVMGTVVSYAVVAEDCDDAIAAARRWLVQVDEIFSPYREGSDITRIANGELTPDAAHPLVAEVIAIGTAAGLDSHGVFTMAPRGRFDPSGVVKGWALERASDILCEAGFTDHLINGGGDVQAHGTREPDLAWRVAIADPRNRQRSVAVLGGHDPIAVATSGISERGEHIERRSGSDLLSITVVGESLTAVDIAATTAFALGDDAREWIDDHPDLAAIAIMSGGRMWSSSRVDRWIVG